MNVISVYFSMPIFFGDQLSYFNERGFEIHILCSPSEKLEGCSKIHGFKYKEIRILRQFSVYQDLKSVFQIYQYIKANKIEIVCGHSPKGALLSMIASYFAGVPKRVFFRHGLVYETTSGLKKQLLINIERLTSFLSTQVVCVSPYLIERSIKDKLTQKDKMILLHKGSCNGVDALSKFNPENIELDQQIYFRKHLKLPSEDFIIGYIGRLVKDKGLIELVEAFNQLKSKYSNITLLLIGPEESKDILPEHIRSSIKTEPRILSLGLIEKDIEYYLSLMSIFVLPTHREGFGNALLEAAAMEIPVLTTSHTGSRDAIVADVTGSYIKMNAESIVDVLSEYIDNPEMAKKRGENGRKFILENFEQIKIWNEIEDKIYNAN